MTGCANSRVLLTRPGIARSMQRQSREYHQADENLQH
jgi:hypothetical protein